ncbi:MAG: hypothetical protein HY337_11915 [Gemmatimonadetes bacterium]|nr:hypothetical protein [Gemmatimonadota bacterium]
MTEQPANDFQPTEADQLLDLYLATLPRFDPRPGFADRVMARVAATGPGSALTDVRPRPAVPTLLRKPALAWGLTGSAAGSSAVLTAWTAANLDAVWATVTAVTLSIGLAAWHALLALGATWSAWAGSAAAVFLAAVGLQSLTSLAAGVVIAMPVSAIGLLLAFRPATQSRKAIHAVR